MRLYEDQNKCYKGCFTGKDNKKRTSALRLYNIKVIIRILRYFYWSIHFFLSFHTIRAVVRIFLHVKTNFEILWLLWKFCGKLLMDDNYQNKK